MEHELTIYQNVVYLNQPTFHCIQFTRLPFAYQVDFTHVTSAKYLDLLEAARVNFHLLKTTASIL